VSSFRRSVLGKLFVNNSKYERDASESKGTVVRPARKYDTLKLRISMVLGGFQAG
jgi:hypothetical protein